MTLFTNGSTNIDKLVEELLEYKGNTRLYRKAKGSILHDFYNACERIFETIARRINGGPPSTGQWHKKLLYQMTIEIEDVRPAVLSKPLAAQLNDYLSFRHLFRNIYGFELESERIDRLAERLPTVAKLLRKEIQLFIDKL